MGSEMCIRDSLIIARSITFETIQQNTTIGVAMPLKMTNPIHDLNLVLGPDGATKVPACSQVMSSASHVFAAMLSGRFTEGRSLSVFTQETLKLPDDDAKSLQVVVRILHHQPKEVPISM